MTNPQYPNGYTEPSNQNPQAPITAPNYMSPGPVLTPQTTWAGNTGNSASGDYSAAQVNFNGGPNYANPNDHNQNVQASIDTFSNQGGAYLSNASRRGLEAANSRGVLNSNIAGGLASRYAMEAMDPYIAQAQDLNKAREGFQFQSGESAKDRGLQVAVENGRMSNDMAQLKATHTFQGSENSYDRSLQSALQEGRIDADTANQLRQIGFQSMQNSLDRTQQSTLQNQQYAYQGEQNSYDRASREKLQSDATFQQDWLSSRSFERDFQSQLSMIPLSAAADLTSYISKYAVENPEVYTPEIVNGMSNFMSQNMASVLGQYFPNQQVSTSYRQSGSTGGLDTVPQGATTDRPFLALGGNN